MRAVPAVTGVLLGGAAATVGIPGFLPGLPVRPWQLLAALAFALAITTARRRGVTRPRILVMDWLFVAFVLLTVVVEAFNSRDLGTGFDLSVVVYPLYPLVGYSAARFTVRHRTDAVVLFRWFALPVVPSGLAAVAQHVSDRLGRVVLNIAPSPNLEALVAKDDSVRATAFVGNWIGAGMYFSAALAAVCCVVVGTPKTRRIGVSVWVAGVSSIVGAVATATISVFVMTVFILGTTVIVGRGRALRFVGSAGSVAAVVAFVVTRRAVESRVEQQTALPYSDEAAETVEATTGTTWRLPSTLAYRVDVWTEQTLPAIGSRPWTGWGAGVLESPARPAMLIWGSAESEWFAVALWFGLPMAAFFVVVLGAIGVFLWRSRSSVSAPIMAMFVAGLISAFIVPAFHNEGLPVAFWALLGVVVSLHASRPAGAEGRTRATVVRSDL